MRFMIVAFTASLFTAGRARACPSCETALQARAALSDRGDFWNQLLLIMLPLMFMSVIAVALHRIRMKAPPDGAEIGES